MERSVQKQRRVVLYVSETRGWIYSSGREDLNLRSAAIHARSLLRNEWGTRACGNRCAGCGMRALVNSHIVDEHGLRKYGAFIRIPRPVAPDRQIQNHKKRM